jgi:hypothetical protein
MFEGNSRIFSRKTDPANKNELKKKKPILLKTLGKFIMKTSPTTIIKMALV